MPIPRNITNEFFISDVECKEDVEYVIEDHSVDHSVNSVDTHSLRISHNGIDYLFNENTFDLYIIDNSTNSIICVTDYEVDFETHEITIIHL